ncbi:MAG: hypothetical protein R2849_07060 [Thermomicrobiales bacterium]
MADIAAREVNLPNEPTEEREGWTPAWIALGILPLLLLAAIIVAIIATDGGIGDRNAPPIEDLSIQRITLPEPGMIEVHVVNQGPDDITIAQVQVDGAYWGHTVDGGRTLSPLESATIGIAYPWVEDDARDIGRLRERHRIRRRDRGGCRVTRFECGNVRTVRLDRFLRRCQSRSQSGCSGIRSCAGWASAVSSSCWR